MFDSEPVGRTSEYDKIVTSFNVIRISHLTTVCGNVIFKFNSIIYCLMLRVMLKEFKTMIVVAHERDANTSINVSDVYITVWLRVLPL